MKSIMHAFPVTESEYEELDRRFGQLAHYAAWQLKKKNTKNNFIDDQEDTVQNIRIALLRAGSYYKRQTYIESSFEVLLEVVTDPFTLEVIAQLRSLWSDRTKHGANKQKFGEHQEMLLDQLLDECVSKDLRPDRNAPLRIDTKFVTYCKQILWNAQKAMGKKITREKSWRAGLASLSEFDYLGATI